MKNVTVISGGTDADKIQRARIISAGKKVFEAKLGLKEAVASMPIGTETIIIDMNFASDILTAIRMDSVGIRLPYSNSETPVFIPDLIIITSVSVEFIERIKATQILKINELVANK